MIFAIAFASTIGLVSLALVGGLIWRELALVRRQRRPKPRPAAPPRRESHPLYVAPRAAHRQGEGRLSRFVISLALAAVLLGLAFVEWVNADASGEWRRVTGQVVASHFEPVSPDSAALRARIQFRYVLGFRQFVSPWVEAGINVDPEERMAFLARYAPGAPLTVWYHPLLPSFPSLTRITVWYVPVLCLLALLALIAGLRALVGGQKGPARRPFRYPAHPARPPVLAGAAHGRMIPPGGLA